MAVVPSRWLPGVWGSTEDDSPTYGSIEQAQRILTLITRHMNGIVWSLQHDPDALGPMFDTLKYPDESREHLDGEMWAHAFMQGIALTRKDWQPLFDDEAMVQVLRPIHLLGSEDVTTEKDALTRTPEQRGQLAGDIPVAVAEIYRYWQPYRETSATPVASTPNVRSNPKAGRNDPCPCGSGKKLKKCCGAPATLH